MRVFRCPECGTTMYAPKKRKTSLGHVKTMYCFKCMKDEQFEQVE